MECRCGGDISFDLAEHVQQLLFPKSSPVCNWCCFGVKNRMAMGLGGDFFEFITMPDGCQVIFLGDVTGHGLHASVVMALLYGFIHRGAMKTCTPLETIFETNRFLLSFAKRSREFDHYFSSTLFFSVIEPKSLEMRYVNCGHIPPLIKREGEILSLTSTGPPIGFFEKPEIGQNSFSFQKGDRFLLFTDGVVEATNRDKAQFGLKRLREFLLKNDDDHLEFLEKLFAALREFDASDPPADDCTAIVTDFHGYWGKT